MSKSIKNTIQASVIVAALFVASMSYFVYAGDKIEICHGTSSESNPTVVITTSVSALETHLSHGDSLFDSVFGCGGGDPQPQ